MEKELKQNKKETLEEAAERLFDGFGDITKPIRPPHSNDCNGHNTSISVGEMDIDQVMDVLAMG